METGDLRTQLLAFQYLKVGILERTSKGNQSRAVLQVERKTDFIVLEIQ